MAKFRYLHSEFQKNLVVWKLLGAIYGYYKDHHVSEELSSVETFLHHPPKQVSNHVSEELSSVETQ